MAQTPLQVPPEPILLRLLDWWQRSPRSVAVNDPRREEGDFTVADLLYDVLTVRKELYETLSNDAKRQLQDPESDLFIALIAHPGYRYCVLLLAIYALGGVAMPLSPNVHPEEFKYFAGITNTVLLTAMPETTQRVNEISALTGLTTYIFDKTARPTGPELGFLFDVDDNIPAINPEKGALLIFSSGTTGPPKGILHSRKSVMVGTQVWVECLGSGTSDTWLHCSPVHWLFGCFLVFMCAASGAKIQFGDSSGAVDVVLRYLQRGQITSMFLPPAPLSTLTDRLESMRQTGDLGQYEATLSGLRGLRILLSGSLTVSAPLRETWRNIREGKPLMVIYGMTESVIPVSSTDWKPGCVDYPMDSCGLRMSQTSIKIADTGEICVKTPGLLKRYLSLDPNAMSAKFDSDGFFKTGDVGRLENDVLYVLGRASEDVIHHRAWKVYAPEVEIELAEHPQVVHAIVQGVPDAMVGDQVAALLVVSGHHSRCQDGCATTPTEKGNKDLDLRAIREWLALERGLSASKLPTMLRTIQSIEEVPTTASMKPIKRKIREKFFGEDQLVSGRIEVWDSSWDEPWLGQRPFDWQGKQI